MARSTPSAPTAGAYAFYNASTRRYLSYQGTSLVLSPSPCQWNLKEIRPRQCHVYAGDTAYILDIHNAHVAEGTTIKLHPLTGYDVQVWRLIPNADGTYAIAYSGNPDYRLGFAGDQAVLQRRNAANPTQSWRVVPLQNTATPPYLSVRGKSGVVHLHLPQDITNVLPPSRLQQWANDLETAYAAFIELTSHTPYSTIVVEGYKPSAYPGAAAYVLDGCNVIHVDRDFLYGDLRKMAVRRHDWNFCVLHEMGHLFDGAMPWNFEAELMTDLKVAYVLEKYGACAAPAEFDAFTIFKGADIIRAYSRLGKDFSVNYDIFACTERFLRIKEEIGWTPFIHTFHYLKANASAYALFSKAERFQTFVKLLSDFSRQDIRRRFSSAEWNAILRQCNRP